MFSATKRNLMWEPFASINNAGSLIFSRHAECLLKKWRSIGRFRYIFCRSTYTLATSTTRHLHERMYVPLSWFSVQSSLQLGIFLSFSLNFCLFYSKSFRVGRVLLFSVAKSKYWSGQLKRCWKYHLMFVFPSNVQIKK